MTNVLVLGYHHPLEIAKRYGTLDVVSAGRLVLGLGVGSLAEEFDLLDRPFADRGSRADDHLRALRAALSQPIPSYDGTHYRFSGMVVDPCATQPQVPLWIGGRSARSLRRAVELGDGWCPFGLTTADTQSMIDQARTTEAWQDRSAQLEIVLKPDRPLDPVGDPARARDDIAALVVAGATMINANFVHHSCEHFLEQLEAMADLLTVDDE